MLMLRLKKLQSLKQKLLLRLLPANLPKKNKSERCITKYGSFLVNQPYFYYDDSMIGIDEVGRGAWAGPLLVVAYRVRGALPERVGDSKKIARSLRESLAKELLLCGDAGFGWVAAGEIDTIGLTAAMRLAVARALTDITALQDEVIIMDGHINYCPQEFLNVTTLVKADAIVPPVSAASIVAKVARDTHLYELAREYPLYGFESHVGYGTKRHQEALRVYGITPEHRLSYAPVRTSTSSIK
jgi:ribonuclease HII